MIGGNTSAYTSKYMTTEISPYTTHQAHHIFNTSCTGTGGGIPTEAGHWEMGTWTTRVGAERTSEPSSNWTMKDQLRARIVSSSPSSDSTAVAEEEIEEGGGDNMRDKRVEEEPEGGGIGTGEGD